MLIKCLGAAVLCTATSSGPAPSQSTAPRAQADRHELVLHVEPIAVGLRHGVPLGKGWRVGPQLIVGPFHGVSLSGDYLRGAYIGDQKEVMSAYAAVSWRPGQRFALVVAPVGITAWVGNDFVVAYPTGQIGLEYRLGRVLVGSDLRVILSYGDWVPQWIPLRVGIDFGPRAKDR